MDTIDIYAKELTFHTWKAIMVNKQKSAGQVLKSKDWYYQAYCDYRLKVRFLLGN